jgi:hypothetical protein
LQARDPRQRVRLVAHAQIDFDPVRLELVPGPPQERIRVDREQVQIVRGARDTTRSERTRSDQGAGRSRRVECSDGARQ